MFAGAYAAIIDTLRCLDAIVTSAAADIFVITLSFSMPCIIIIIFIDACLLRFIYFVIIEIDVTIIS